MKESADPRASMIVNFDSTEQLRQWRLIEDEQRIGRQLGKELWLSNAGPYVCEHILNTHPEFVRYFAGVLRTAYLYCPKIVLTDAQLFDGMFFLALGPEAVNDILGTSYKDKPAIVVSGREDSLEDSLVACMSKCIVAENKPARDSFQSSALDSFISEDMSSEFADHFSTAFTQGLQQSGNRHRKAEVIAEAYATMLGIVDKPSFLEHDRPHRLLAQRWQEWIDAERRGLIIYENQNDPTSRTHVANNKFDKTFKQYAVHYGEVLLIKHDVLTEQKRSENSGQEKMPSGGFSTSGGQFDPMLQQAVNKLSTKPKRSAAFDYIGNVTLRDDGSDCQCVTRAILRDWYQFIYMKALAHHLGIYLMAVNVPANSFVQIAGQGSQDTSMTLSGKITDTLGEMPFIRFTSFRYECRSAIRRWQECDPSTPRRERKYRTKTISYLIEQAQNEHDLTADAKNILKGTALAALIALITALVDNLWTNGTTPVWVIVCIAWTLAIMPNLIDAVQWIVGVESSKQTVAFANEYV
ncbi:MULTISPECIES: hypothetical protein [Bifidobacterium]|jgi:hypothetical protein|uniref:hypothetical protein n=1 Tax=Bifidobacterium TaxID=1678 RepID=UPI0023535A79|nr:hypothetical protein [Bifidobacterium tibiigranuli]MCI1211648.1 hypothetical protein [Bifidobacterium tibiigranuli]MCI1221124.1 hypothetical protein [Bifidobacterium tibiigranuli]MCI1798167.1 hypothetical protein [Bifidobacterium tibiigranuli]